MKSGRTFLALTLTLLLPAVASAVDAPARVAGDPADAYADARKSLAEAEAAFVQVRQGLTREAMTSPEYVAAVKDVDAAFTAYAAKRDKVLAELQKDQRYTEQQKEIAARDAQIEAAGQNPATTAKDFADLCGGRDSLARSRQTLIDDAMKREGAAPQQQQWVDACKKLAETKLKVQAEVEKSPKLKPATDRLAAARAAVGQARANLRAPAASADQETATADEYLRQYPRYGLGLGDEFGKPAPVK